MNFNGSINNHLFNIDLIFTSNGYYMVLTFKKYPKKLLKRQHIFLGQIYFRRGHKTIDERIDVLRRWESQIDFDELKEKFFNTQVKKPVIYFGQEMKIDFNTLLEEVFDENLLENSWKKLTED